MKVPGKRELVTQSVHLEEHCTSVESKFHLFHALLFLTNLVFKYNSVNGHFFDNVDHNLLMLMFLPFD